MAKKTFYVVWKGRNPGVYSSWIECENQVKHFSGASFRGFATREAAEAAYQQGEDVQAIKKVEQPEPEGAQIPEHVFEELSSQEQSEGENEYF